MVLNLILRFRIGGFKFQIFFKVWKEEYFFPRNCQRFFNPEIKIVGPRKKVSVFTKFGPYGTGFSPSSREDRVYSTNGVFNWA